MARFTLYCSDAAKITDATEAIRSTGARVIAAKPGLALIETTDAIAEQLRDMLSDWKVTKESTAKIPSPRPIIPPAQEK